MLKDSAVDCLLEGMQLWMRLGWSCAPGFGTGFLCAVRSVLQFLYYKGVRSMRIWQNLSSLMCSFALKLNLTVFRPIPVKSSTAILEQNGFCSSESDYCMLQNTEQVLGMHWEVLWAKLPSPRG